MPIMRLGHLKVLVHDLDAAVAHYTEVLGLIESHRDAGETVYLKGWDEWDSYSIVLQAADRAGLEHLAFKVRYDEDLDALQASLAAYGVSAEACPAGELPFCGRSVRFELPSGHEAYLYAEKEFVGKSVGSSNPDPWPDGLKGIGVHWLDHVTLVCPVDLANGINKVAENARFFKEVFDFGLSEQVVVGPDEDIQMAAFMFCTTTAHDIAFVAGAEFGLHHISFFLDDWADILKASDILAKKKVRVDVTPQRHGITRGSTTYFFDPSGNRNETFAGLGYVTQKDMPIITWTEENFWRGIFYHTGQQNDGFLSVHT